MNNNDNSELSITVTDWPTGCESLFAVRREVFVDELGVPADQEQDPADAHCSHVLATTADGVPVAAGRLLSDATISRVAVLKSWRGRGVGRRVTNELLDLARKKDHAVVALEAPREVRGFFRRLGFRAAAGQLPGPVDAEQVLSLELASWDRSDDRVRQLDGVSDSLNAVRELISSARRGIDIYLPYVHPALLGSGEIAGALSARVIEQSRFQVRLVLPPANDWRRACPDLSSRISRLGALQLRTWPAEEPRERVEFSYGYWLSDDAMIQHTDLRACLGEFNPKGLRLRREVGNFFNDCWARAVSDGELRSLGC